MQLLLYILVYPLIWIISILPFPVLYFLSDCVFFLVYRIIKYRKRVVRQNIALALPHLSDKERNIMHYAALSFAIHQYTRNLINNKGDKHD